MIPDVQDWRVVLATGEIRKVVVIRRSDDAWRAEWECHDAWSDNARGAVLELAADWPISEIAAPGELTRAETLARCLAFIRERLDEIDARDYGPMDEAEGIELRCELGTIANQMYRLIEASK